MAKPVILKIIVDGNDGEKSVRGLRNSFDQTEAAARRAANAISKITDKDVFARSAQTSKQFLNEIINSGGMKQYQEVLRTFAPQLRTLQEQLKQGAFSQEDFNRRVAALPPLVRRALGDVSSLGKGIKGLGDEAEHGANGFQSMLIKADLVGRGIALLTSAISNGWREYINFGKEVANVNSILGDGGNINSLRDGILSLKPELGGATELTHGLYQALSSGIQAKDSIDFITISAKTAKAGLASVYDTVDAGTTVMAAFGLEAKDATKIYDEMFETVKRGKIELPQLAQSIGQVASIASLAGVSMEELFAATATATLSNKPAQAIEGLRTALSNIIKPSDDAKKLSAELGLEFNATALKTKGFAAFLEEVAAKTGGSAEKLNVLFGDVQGFNIIASLGGERAKVFADNLNAMGNAAGGVDVAFIKQQQSLGAQFETFYNRVGNGLIKIFTSVEPTIKLVLSAVNYLLPVIVALTVVVGGLRLAWLLMNTQFFTTAATAIPNVIVALGLMSEAVVSVAAGTATLGVTLGVATGGLTILAAGIGLAVYAYSSMETAIERADKITLDSVNNQNQSLQTQQQLAVEIRQVADAQEGSADRHDKLNAILGRLDPVTQSYIQSLTGEQQQISRVTQEIERNIEVRKSVLEATLRTVAEGILPQKQGYEQASEALKSYQVQVNAAQADLDKYIGIPVAERTSQQSLAFSEAKEAALVYSQKVTDTKVVMDGLNTSLTENEVKLIQSAKGLGLNSEQLREFFTRLGYTKEQIDFLVSGYDRATNSQNNLANGMQNTTGVIDQQTNAIKSLRDQLKGLISESQTRIDERVAAIALSAKDKAEAVAMAKRSMGKDDFLFQDFQNTKRLRENQKAVEDTFNPSEKSKTSPRTRTPNPEADFRRENRVISGNAQWDKYVYEFAKKYAVDSNLIFAQMTQESSFKKGAVSNKGASGLMQLMPATARDLGVKNIFDPKQNIEAGVKYLRQQLDKFGGNVALALAAYNAGPGAVIKYKGIPPYKETQDYVKRISANYARIKGKPEYGGNFDYERSLQEQSDTKTKDFRDSQTMTAIDSANLFKVMPDADVMRDYNRILVEQAKKTGEIQPELEATIAKFKGFRDAPTVSDAPIETRPLDRRSERFADLSKNLIGNRQKELDERRLYLADEILIKENDYILSLGEAQTDLQVEYALLQKRNLSFEAANEFSRQRNAQVKELGDIEINLDVLRRQNSDDQFVEQRRLLSAKREQLSLEQEISDLKDDIANSGANDGLRIEAAALRDIVDLRNRETDAIIASNRAESELSQQMKVSNNEIRAQVLGHLASQKTMSDALADGINQTYDAIASKLDENIDKAFKWAGALKSIFTEPLKAIARNNLTNITRSLLDKFLPPELSKSLKATNNPVARPIVDKLDESNEILKQIQRNTSRGALPGVGGSGGGSTGGGILGFIRSLFGGGGGSANSAAGNGSSANPFAAFLGNYRPDTNALNAGLKTGATNSAGQVVVNGNQGNNGIGSIFSNLKKLFSTKDGGLFARRGGNGEAGSGSRTAGIAGGIGDIASFAGGLIGGRAGGIISSIGQGVSIGSAFGPWGALIGGGIGALVGILGGDPKKKEDKKQNLPQLQQGFVDSIKEYKQLIDDAAKLKTTDFDGTLKRADEIRAAISNGFNIDFKSKKYRKVAKNEIAGQLKAIDLVPGGLHEQLIQAVAKARSAREFSNKFVATFADGVYMDAGFRNQYQDFKRQNGMMPGSWTGKDYIPALIADAEMVINPSQRMQVIKNAGGVDPFDGAGIPNYKPTKEPAKLSTGAFIGNSQNSGSTNSNSSGQNVGGKGEWTFNIYGVAITDQIAIFATSPEGENITVKNVRKHVATNPDNADGLARDLKKAQR